MMVYIFKRPSLASPRDADHRTGLRDADTCQLRELYATLSAAVEAEIAAAAEAAREADTRTRFPNPDGNPGGAAPEPDNSRHGYDREDRERGRNRGYGEDGRGQGYRRGSGAEDRDRSYPRNHDGGRGNYRERNGRDDGRSEGSRRSGSWRECGGGSGGSRGGAATQAQVKAVFGIAKGRGIERRDLMERIEDQFGVRRVEDLDVRQASRLIEELKAA